ncbi:uncharacterized protein PAC_08309 [Phialocephala subalpina]|uniref:Uncharacterized protein n=1 Tax=Phialocephala subalpina TaxID=576137 RepID=A0A1L7X075_9HELO|nr:uncharacterized protein PAC_08309 [Phialocephala subalpina]
MATSSTYYTGIWINESKGAVLGATHTVSPRVGVILVAVLALFVSLAGTLTQYTDFNAYRRENVDLSRKYVTDCLNGYQASPQCNVFKRNQLSFTTSRNSSCSFSSKMCLGPEYGSLYLDTGLLGSRDDFGVNSKRSDRVLYRKTMSCSPIATEGYIVSGNSTWNGRGYNYTAAYYGPNNYMLLSLDEFGSLINATYVHSDYKQLALGYNANLDNSMYTVIPVVGYPGSPMDEFAPIPELVSPNGSTTLDFAAFEGLYLEPSDDLWLSAHKSKLQDVVSHSDSGDKRTNFTVHAIDKPVSVLGCLEQHHICNPNRPKDSATRCSPQMDLESLYSFNQSDLSIRTISSCSIATGPSGRDSRYAANAAANDTSLQWYCDRVIIRNGGYVSFSVLAIGLVVGLGGLIVLSSLFFETAVGWIKKQWKRQIDRQAYWNLHSALQLQRMAFEEAGLGTWERCAEEIPVTARGEMLQVATEQDEWHPSIRGRQTMLEPSVHPESRQRRERCSLPDSVRGTYRHIELANFDRNKRGANRGSGTEGVKSRH